MAMNSVFNPVEEDPFHDVARIRRTLPVKQGVVPRGQLVAVPIAVQGIRFVVMMPVIRRVSGRG